MEKQSPSKSDHPLYHPIVQHDNTIPPPPYVPVEQITPVGSVTPQLLPGVKYVCTSADSADSKPETVTLIVQQPQPLSNPLPAQQVPQEPGNFLPLSICGCLFCIWPVGIIAILLSLKVSSDNKSGDLRSAKKYSHVTLIVNILNILGGIAIILYILISRGMI